MNKTEENRLRRIDVINGITRNSVYTRGAKLRELAHAGLNKLSMQELEALQLLIDIRVEDAKGESR